MASKKFNKIVFVLSILLVFPMIGCKKNSTAPQVDSLTRPVIWLNTFEMTFSGFKSGGQPKPQTLNIKNNGIDTLKYDISCDVDWLEVEPSSGSSSGKANVHEVVVKKAHLDARKEPYTTTIKVTDPNSYNNPQEVKVSFTVSSEPPPKIGVSPKNLSFSAQKGGSNPPAQTIEITNTGDGTLEYKIESDAGWLNVSPNKGTSQTKPKTHTVSISVGSLTIGTHNGTLTISDPSATNNPQTVAVSLDITKEPPPEIWTNASRIEFNATEGGANPPAAKLQVKNSGGGTLKYTIDWDGAWMSVNPTSGSSGGNVNSHTVSVTSSGKSAGTYNGMITIKDPNASNSPYNVNVKLVVTAPIGNNRIGIGCNPSSATPGTTVSIPISISGNHNAINTFGLRLNFDANMFQFLSVSKGNLTGNWAAVAGNETSPGVVTVGGFAGSGTTISVGSSGSIAVVTLRVTGASYPNGQQSQLNISNYTDGIAGMSPEPANTTFTLQK